MMRADNTFASILTGSEFLNCIAMGMAKGVKTASPGGPTSPEGNQSHAYRPRGFITRDRLCDVLLTLSDLLRRS